MSGHPSTREEPKLNTENRQATAQPIASDAELLRAVLDRDDTAWRELVRRYDPELREVVRHAAEAINPLQDDQIDDVLGDFWLRLVADDFRMLRAFNPSRQRAALFTWLTFQVAHVAHEYLRRIGNEPEKVPLDCALNVAAPTPAPRRESRGSRAQAERALLSDLADFLVALTLDGKLGEDSQESPTEKAGLDLLRHCIYNGMHDEEGAAKQGSGESQDAPDDVYPSRSGNRGSAQEAG